MSLSYSFSAFITVSFSISDFSFNRDLWLIMQRMCRTCHHNDILTSHTAHCLNACQINVSQQKTGHYYGSLSSCISLMAPVLLAASSNYFVPSTGSFLQIQFNCGSMFLAGRSFEFWRRGLKNR